MNNFNWGIIGPGKIAHTFAKALQVVDGAKLYGVASRSKERAELFAKEYHATKIYTSYEEIVNDPGISAIYIATTHRFHFEQAKLALEAGKPVLCEKPLTVNASQATELIELANEKNVFLMEALWTRFLPIYKVVRNWLDEKLIGEVKLMNSTFGYAFERDLKDRKFNHEVAGGSILDLGIYNISVSNWVMNQNPKSFSVHGIVGEDSKVDEMIAGTLEFENGVMSQFNCNLITQTDNKFIIYGSNGHIKIHDYFWGATRATIKSNNKEVTVKRPFKATGFEYEIEEAMNCIREGKLESSIISHEHTLNNLHLIDSIRKEIGLKYSFE